MPKKKTTYLWFLYRRYPGMVGPDECTARIVRARNDQQARALAQPWHDPFEPGAREIHEDEISCRRLLAQGITVKILSAHRRSLQGVP